MDCLGDTRGETDLDPMVKDLPSLESCLQTPRNMHLPKWDRIPKTVLGSRQFQLSDSPWNREQSEAEYRTRRQRSIHDLAKAQLSPVKKEGLAVEIKNGRFRNRNREVCAPDRLLA
jgi:hypothetical protein